MGLLQICTGPFCFLAQGGVNPDAVEYVFFIISLYISVFIHKNKQVCPFILVFHGV